MILNVRKKGLFISMKSIKLHVNLKIHRLLVMFQGKVFNKHFLKFLKEQLQAYLHKVDVSIHIKNSFKLIQQTFSLSLVEHLMESRKSLNVV